MDPREYGLSAKDLRAAADRLYAPDDPRLDVLTWTYAVEANFGRIRSRLHAMADELKIAEENAT